MDLARQACALAHRLCAPRGEEEEAGEAGEAEKGNQEFHASASNIYVSVDAFKLCAGKVGGRRTEGPESKLGEATGPPRLSPLLLLASKAGHTTGASQPQRSKKPDRVRDRKPGKRRR
jgi:hypothetical protein